MNIYTILSLLLLTYKVSANYKRGLWNTVGELFYPIKQPVQSEDARLNITELATKYGYKLEEHTVITNDGYVLNCHRIPHGRKKKNNGLVAFLMHGIMDSSDNWVLQGSNKALAYVLADEGFDVWLGNARGNKHALKHTNTSGVMPEFWKFSWEQIGLYDVPAMIDYVLNTTRKESLYYIGHSQGCTIFYAMCSMKPEYNKKIKMMFSLAPVAWIGNTKSPLAQTLSPARNVLGYLFQDINTHIAENNTWYNKLTLLCNITPTMCKNFINEAAGYSSKIDDSFLSVILGHSPTGTSLIQFIHYGQLYESKRFCRYDYGEENNIVVYGRRSPPDYDLNKVDVPIVLYYSDADLWTNPIDINTLKKHLPNVYAEIHISDFSHLDFIYAPEAVSSIYKNIITQIHKYEKSDEDISNFIVNT